MKKYLSILFVFTVSLSFSQNHYLGLQVGSNFSNVISDSDFELERESLVSFSSGIIYDFQFKNGILLGSGLLYERKGDAVQVAFTNQEGISVGDGEIRNKFDYITLPLKIGYSIGDKWSAFAYLGVVPAYLIQANTTASSNEIPDFESHTYDIVDRAERFELSGLFEIGCNYQIKERIKLFLNTSYSYAFTDAYKDLDFRMLNHRLNVSLGVKYALKAGEL